MSHKCQSILFAPNGGLLGEMASVSADLAHGYVIPEHSHPEDQLLFASSGVMTLRTKQGVWVVPPLRAVWIPADTPHTVAMSGPVSMRDRKSTRLNSSHGYISYAVFCLKKKK